MNAEQESHELPRSIELPIPKTGVTKEIFFELLADRARFIRHTLEKMKEENPVLVNRVVVTCLETLYPDTALGFILTYYEIFSRSVNDDEQLFLVSDDMIKAQSAQYLREFQAAENGSEEVLQAFMARKQAHEDELHEQEVNSSEELASFWIRVLGFESANVGHLGFLATSRLTYPARYLREILKAQEAANRFKSNFPS